MAEEGYVKVSPQELVQASEAIRKIAASLDDRLDVLRNELQQKLVWHDAKSSLEYRAYQAQWDTAVTELNRILNEIGGKIGQSAQNYIDTEFNVAGMWANR